MLFRSGQTERIGLVFDRTPREATHKPRLRKFVWVVASLPWRRGPHRQGDDTGVYTVRWKWPPRRRFGHLCTLLRRELRQVARAPQPPRRAGGAPLLAPPAWSGSASGAAARLASSPGCQPTRTPEEPISYGGFAVLWGVETPWRREAL